MKKLVILLVVLTLVLSSCSRRESMNWRTRNVPRFMDLPLHLIDEKNTMTLLDFRDIKMGTTYAEMFKKIGIFHGYSGITRSWIGAKMWFYQLSDASHVTFSVMDIDIGDSVREYVDSLTIHVYNKFRVNLYQYDPNCEVSYARYLQVFEEGFDDFAFIERELCLVDILGDLSRDMTYDDVVELLGEPNGYRDGDFDVQSLYYQLADTSIIFFVFGNNEGLITISVIDPVGSVLETVHNYNRQARNG
jgi:hypothetical protein